MFSIPPAQPRHDPLYAEQPSGFSTEMLEYIARYGTQAIPEAAQTGTGEKSGRRTCLVGWLTYGPGTHPIYQALGMAMRQINVENFGIDVAALFEPLQYTVYHEGDHYDWHMDKGPATMAPRKLSASLILSHPDDYDGGDLEFNFGGGQVTVAARSYANLVVFPSYVLHRVAPVTRGTRVSLVAWMSGPRLR